jgi:hypothetical protein
LTIAPQRSLFPRFTIILTIAAIASGGTGCGLFNHRETPQQQFTEALGRGNSVQASYIWNNMSAQDRAKFERGEGISPKADSNAVSAQIEEHRVEQAGEDEEIPATIEIPVDN